MANFEASRLKVARSRTHLWALVEAIRAYQLRAPFHIEVEIDNGKKFWVVKVREEVPLEFSAILGDSIHNLRAALDLLASIFLKVHSASRIRRPSAALRCTPGHPKVSSPGCRGRIQ